MAKLRQGFPTLYTEPQVVELLQRWSFERLTRSHATQHKRLCYYVYMALSFADVMSNRKPSHTSCRCLMEVIIRARRSARLAHQRSCDGHVIQGYRLIHRYYCLDLASGGLTSTGHEDLGSIMKRGHEYLNRLGIYPKYHSIADIVG